MVLRYILILLLFLFFTIHAGETVFFRSGDIKKIESSCTVKNLYKIKRSSFYSFHADNADELIKCISAYGGDSVLKDTPLNMEYKSEVSDRYIDNQWHLRNTGQTGIAGNDAKVIDAWDYIESLELVPGKGVKIGVIDDAFDVHHPDMKGKFLIGLDLIDGDNYPYIDDNEPHGTCVSGVAAAVRNNGIGVAGVCPECRIVPVRASDKLGQTEKMAAAFNYLLDRGVHVISNSWGPTDGGGGVELPEVIKEIIFHARTEERDGKGVVIFFAAGNGNEDISDPATFDGFAANPDVIAVGAVNASGVRSAYSDFGADLDILSPSSDIDEGYVWDPYAIDMMNDGIWTIDARSYYGYFQTDYTASFGGTSSAAPLAAAVAGLLISVYPDITWDEVYELLTDTADKVSPDDAEYDENGFSRYYGFGRINAFAALKKLCSEKKCEGGLANIDEDVYPSVDLDLADDTDPVMNDDTILPGSEETSGCSIIIF